MKLLPYQLEAVKKMKNGCVLLANVGRGKSITALSYYWLTQNGPESYLTGGDAYKLKNPTDLYIITTPKKRDNQEWGFELLWFGLGENKDISYQDANVVVDSWNNIEKYVKVKNAFFIFDEQRAIGKGQWAKCFVKIAQQNHWVMITATPGDSWKDYIPLFVANGFYKNRTEFNDRHIIWKPHVSYPAIQGYVDTRRLVRLRDSITVDMRGQNPAEQIHNYINVSYDRDLYRLVAKERFDIYKNEPIQNASQYCQCLRRIVYSDCSRQMALLELLEDNPRMIVFYNYDFELDILLEILGNIDGLDIAQWNGHAHDEIPDSASWVYLVQYTAGAEGWNCIKTNVIVFYSQNYSYKIMAQASGRIDRLNTPYSKLFYYHLVSKSGIDASVTRALRDKKQFSEGRFWNQQLKNINRLENKT